MVPGIEYVQRKKGKGFEVGCIAGWAAGRGYKHLVIVNEGQVSALHAAQVFAFIDRAHLRCDCNGQSTQQTNGVF